MGLGYAAFSVGFAGDFVRNLLGWWGFALVAMALVGAAVFVLWRIPLPSQTWRPPWMLILLVGTTGCSIAWSAYPLESTAGWVVQLATAVVGVAVVRALPPASIVTALGAVLRWIIAASVVFELIVTFLIRHPVLPVWASVPSNEKVPLMLYWSRNTLLETGKIQGIVGNSSLIAMIALLAAIVTLFQLWQRSLSLRPGLMWLALIGATGVATRSATIFVATAVVLGVAVIVLGLRRARSARVRTLIVTGAGAGALALAGVAFLCQTHVLALLGKSDDLTGRAEIWETVSRLALDRPIFGWGWVSYWPPWAAPYEGLMTRNGVPVLHAHNAWLDIWLQTGIVGVAVFLVMIVRTVVLLTVGVSRSRAGHDSWPVAALLILTALVVQSLSESRILIEGGWLMVAIIAVSAHCRSGRPLPSPPSPSRRGPRALALNTTPEPLHANAQAPEPLPLIAGGETPLRIALVIDYSMNFVGGAQTAFIAQAHALAQAGHAVTVIAPAGDLPHGSGLRTTPFAYRRAIPVLDLPLIRNSARVRRNVSAVLADHSIDIVHVHSEFGLAAAAMQVAKLSGIPVVHTVHTFFWVGPQLVIGKRLVAFAIRTFHRWITGLRPIRTRLCDRLLDSVLRNMTLTSAQGAGLVISPSGHQAALLRSAGLDSVATVPNTCRLSDAERGQPIMKLDGPLRIVWAGRCSAEKRLLPFIDACVMALDALPAAALRIEVIGDGPQLASARVAAEAAGASITFRGTVPHRDVVDHFKESHLVALTSFGFDNQPMIVVEALYAKRGVFYVDPALREGLAEAGLFCEAPDASHMARALISLARNTEPVIDASNRAAQAFSAFTPESFRAATTGLYRKLLESNSPPDGSP